MYLVYFPGFSSSVYHKWTHSLTHYYKNCKELSSVLGKQFKGKAYLLCESRKSYNKPKIFYWNEKQYELHIHEMLFCMWFFNFWGEVAKQIIYFILEKYSLTKTHSYQAKITIRNKETNIQSLIVHTQNTLILDGKVIIWCAIYWSYCHQTLELETVLVLKYLCFKFKSNKIN